MLFLSGLPIWAALLLLVVLPSIVAMGALILVRRWISPPTNNEIAGFKFATIGVIYAVLAAFAVIVVWEKFSEAQNAVVHEAGASEALYRLAAGPDPKMAAARAALSNYLKIAIDREWPRMAREEGSHEATEALGALYAAVLRLPEAAPGQTPLLIEMFRQIDTITQARRTRLHLATGIVPPIIWLVLFSGAGLTVAFTFFFGTKNLRAQVLMTGALSALTFMALFVIVEIDHPFTGPSYVRSDPLKDVLQENGP